jgi:hypothetical protein
LLRETMRIDVTFDTSVRARLFPSVPIRAPPTPMRAPAERLQARPDGGRNALAIGERHADLEVRIPALGQRGIAHAHATTASLQVWPNTAAQMAAELHANAIEDGGPTGIAGYEGIFVAEYAIFAEAYSQLEARWRITRAAHPHRRYVGFESAPTWADLTKSEKVQQLQVRYVAWRHDPSLLLFNIRVVIPALLGLVALVCTAPVGFRQHFIMSPTHRAQLR